MSTASAHQNFSHQNPGKTDGRLAERIERSAWRDVVDASGALGTALGLTAYDLSGALVLSATSLPSLLFNRVIGLGTDRPAGESEVETVLATYAARGIEHFWVHVGEHARSHGLDRCLERHGLAEYPRTWTKFLRDVEPFIARPSSLAVRLARVEDAALIGDIVAPAFDLPPAAGGLFGNLVGRAGWHLHVVTDGERVVAAGALYIAGTTAYHAFAATHPRDRHRGAQSLLMESRIRQARALGCHRIASETGAPRSPDEANPSYHNMLRCGFRPVESRANFAPHGTRW